MLVLSRKAGDEILIEPAGIRIQIAKITGARGKQRVAVAISAPENQTISRGELLPSSPKYDPKRKEVTDGTKNK